MLAKVLNKASEGQAVRRLRLRRREPGGDRRGCRGLGIANPPIPQAALPMPRVGSPTSRRPEMLVVDLAAPAIR